jgi:hypothetical protein
MRAAIEASNIEMETGNFITKAPAAKTPTMTRKRINSKGTLTLLFEDRCQRHSF